MLATLQMAVAIFQDLQMLVHLRLRHKESTIMSACSKPVSCKFGDIDYKELKK